MRRSAAVPAPTRSRRWSRGSRRSGQSVQPRKQVEDALHHPGRRGLVAGRLSNAVSIPALGVVEVATYLAWFLLGFLLYAAAFATVAALVSRPEEIQSATAPVVILLAGSYILMFFALPDPTSPWVTVLSFLPPAAPIFMPMRIAEVGVAPWQVALAMALMVAAIGGVVWLAGRIYANAAMHTGKRVPFLQAYRG